MGALSSPDGGKDFMDAFQAALRDVVIPDPAQRSEEHYRGCQEVWSYIDARIDEAFTRTAKSRNELPTTEKQVRIIDELVKASDDKPALRFLIISLFMPAHDNLAVAVSNVFFHLARNPEAWAKLRNEIMEKADQPLTHGLLTSLKYLNWVLKESKNEAENIFDYKLTDYDSVSPHPIELRHAPRMPLHHGIACRWRYGRPESSPG